MWDITGALVLIAALALWLLIDAIIVGFGGALAEARERKGWTPDRSVYDVDDVTVAPVVCGDCGQKLTDVLVVHDGAGRRCLSGCTDAARLHVWHRAIECSGVRT